MEIFKKTIIVCVAIAAFLIFMPIACAGGCAGCLALGSAMQETKNKEATEKLQKLAEHQKQNKTSTVVAKDIKNEESVPSVPKNSFGDGQFVVGVDIIPGRYRSAIVDQNSPFPLCTYSRLNNFDGTIDSIIARKVINKGNAIVEIKKSDMGFESQGCVTWTKID